MWIVRVFFELYNSILIYFQRMNFKSRVYDFHSRILLNAYANRKSSRSRERFARLRLYTAPGAGPD